MKTSAPFSPLRPFEHRDTQRRSISRTSDVSRSPGTTARSSQSELSRRGGPISSRRTYGTDVERVPAALEMLVGLRGAAARELVEHGAAAPGRSPFVRAGRSRTLRRRAASPASRRRTRGDAGGPHDDRGGWPVVHHSRIEIADIDQLQDLATESAPRRPHPRRRASVFAPGGAVARPRTSEAPGQDPPTRTTRR